MKIYKLRAEDTQTFNSSSVLKSQNFLLLRLELGEGLKELKC